MVGVQTLSMTLVLALSLPFGTGGVGIADLSLIGVAALGILGWALSDEPVVATTFAGRRGRAAGVALMLPKTWRDPWSETLSTFVLASASGFLSAVAVGALDASLLPYPAYFAVANGGIAAVIAHRRRMTRRPWRLRPSSLLVMKRRGRPALREPTALRGCLSTTCRSRRRRSRRGVR